MKCLLRILLITLLVAALPVKGFAASGVMPCGLTRVAEHRAEAGERGHTGHAAGVHGHPPAYTNEADAADPSAGGPYAPATQADSDDSGAAPAASADHDCMHCAACTVAAASPTIRPLVPVLPAGAQAPPTECASWQGVTLLLHERPPKPSLA